MENEAASPSPTVRRASPEQLVDALKDPSTSEDAKVEAERRISSNVATKLAVRFLLPRDEADREDAFDGLVGLCWKARGNLHLEPTVSEQAQGETLWQCTREFVEDFVLAFFAPYHGMTELDLMCAALRDEFRYIGRRSWSRMANELRTRTAPRNQEPRQVSLERVMEQRQPDTDDDQQQDDTPQHEDEPQELGREHPQRRQELEQPDELEEPEAEDESLQAENELPTTDSQAAGSSGARYSNASAFIDFLKAREPSLSATLGKVHYEVLLAEGEAYPHAYEGSDQQMKSALTRAIERRRQVSPQVARQNKRDLSEKVSAEVQRGNPDLNDFHALVARGDDDHTLRHEFVSANGRRKRSIKFRIELPRRPSFSRDGGERD